jgi:hypothetical protein
MAGGGARGGSDRAAGAAHSPTTTTAIQSTIQSIKEVVGGHSDADILYTLRESNMDPNETAQKLLNQGSPLSLPCYPDLGRLDRSRAAPGARVFVARAEPHWVSSSAAIVV